MSRDNEEIADELKNAEEALSQLNKILNNRIFINAESWKSTHREDCKNISIKIQELILAFSSLK